MDISKLLPIVISIASAYFTFKMMLNEKQQKRISYDMYNLNLFNKRFDNYFKFRACYLELCSLAHPDAIFSGYTGRMELIIEPLLECSYLFPRNYANGTTGELATMVMKLNEKIDLENELNNLDNLSKNRMAYENEEENLDTKIYILREKLVTYNSFVYKYGKEALRYMEDYLRISHQPH